MAAEVAEPEKAEPVITRVRYQDGVLTVSWTGSTGLGIGFLVMVWNGSTKVVDASVGTANSARLLVEVPPGETYEVQVGASGRASAKVAILTATAAIELAETAAATGALTLSWPAAGPDRCMVRLVVNGGAPDPESPPVAGGSLRIDQPPPAGSTVAAALARVRESPGLVVIGPYGPAFAVPTAEPELLAVGYEAGRLSVAWHAVPGADGYRVSVLTERGVLGTPVEVAAPATTAELEPAITDPGRYLVVVQAVGEAGTGPTSAPLGIPLTAPTITGVTSNGSTVSIDLRPPDSAPTAPTGYAAVLLRDGVPVVRESLGPAGTLSLAVPEPRPRGAAYTVAVRAQLGRAVGPAASAPAVPATAAVGAVVCDTDLVVTAGAGHLAAGVPIEAVLLADGVPGTPERVGPDGTAVFTVRPGRLAVAVRGVDGVATGPWSAPVPAPSAPVAVTLARADGGQVALAWSGPADGGYRVAVGDTARLIQGQSARLPLTADRMTVAQVAGPARGPVTALDLVTSGPRLTEVAIGGDRAVTVRYAPPPAPPLTAVRPVLRWDGTEFEAADQPAGPGELTLTLPDGVPNTATLALRGVAGAAAGPPGPAAVLLTAAPGGLRVAYDGSTLRVRWTALASPLVDGYRVSLTADGTETVLGDTHAPEGSWPVEIADPAATVTVRGTAGPALGAATPPVPVYTGTLVVGGGHLAPQWGPELTPHQLTLGLPELFAPPRREPVPLPFGCRLTPAADGPYPYLLHVPADSRMWDFTERPDVIAAWAAAFPGLGALGLTPYGYAALGEALSRAVPQTFAETLYFAYGLRFDQGHFDLRPGLVLRVEYESYQTIQADTAVSGFVTGGVADYEVASYDNGGTWTTGLDAFLAQLTLWGGTAVPAPVWTREGQLSGAGGALDLFAAPLRERPFARLVLPVNQPSALSSSKGSPWPKDNAVLVAAAGLAGLAQATDHLRGRATAFGDAAAAYPRGRAVLRAMVRVSVNGAPRLVPLGTTLGNLLAGAGRRPAAVPLPLDGVTLHRARAAAALADGPDGDWPVLPGWRPRDPAALDLPLLHGDRLDLATDAER